MTESQLCRSLGVDLKHGGYDRAAPIVECHLTTVVLEDAQMSRLWLKSTILAGGLVALPLSVPSADGKVWNDAGCQTEEGGTCCAQTTSVCYPNNCSNPICSLDDHYWKSDGSAC